MASQDFHFNGTHFTPQVAVFRSAFTLSTLTGSQPSLVSLDLRTVAGDYVNEEIFHMPPSLRLGSLTDNSDGNEDVKKAIGVMSKTTTLHVHHAFLYSSLPSLHDYDVKMLDRKLYGGRKQGMTNVYFLFLNLSTVSK